VSFRIEYPAAALQEAGHANGPFVPGGVVSLWNAEEPGVVVFAASGAWDWTQGGGLLAELVFNVLPGITAQTSWPISLIAVEVTADGFENRTLATRGATVGGETVAHPRIIVGESGMVSAGFEVVFQGQAGMQYDLQRSEDLEQWSDVTQVFGISDEMRVIDWGAAGRPAGFYRVHRRQ
jgi:hypothetical protein